MQSRKSGLLTLIFCPLWWVLFLSQRKEQTYVIHKWSPHGFVSERIPPNPTIPIFLFELQTKIAVNLPQRSLAPRKDDIALCLKSESREEYNECNWARPCPVDLVFTIDGTVSRVGYTTQIFGPCLLMFMHDKLWVTDYETLWLGGSLRF